MDRLRRGWLSAGTARGDDGLARNTVVVFTSDHGDWNRKRAYLKLGVGDMREIFLRLLGLH